MTRVSSPPPSFPQPFVPGFSSGPILLGLDDVVPVEVPASPVSFPGLFWFWHRVNHLLWHLQVWLRHLQGWLLIFAWKIIHFFEELIITQPFTPTNNLVLLFPENRTFTNKIRIFK
jgi:hypothetical protein